MDKRTSDLMFSSKIQNWRTPQALYDKLNANFMFDLDVAADDKNTKCHRYLDEKLNSLAQKWHEIGRVCWMNPPYGRGIGKWIEKAWYESTMGCTVVCLIPARTDTLYWHNYVMKSSEVRFIKGRVKFELPGVKTDPAPFPSAIVIFRPNMNEPIFKGMDNDF